MKTHENPLGVSPSKGYQGTTRGKEKILMTSVGIEPTTSGLDLPLLCRLSHEVGHPSLGLTPSGFFMGSLSTLTYASELILYNLFHTLPVCFLYSTHPFTALDPI